MLPGDAQRERLAAQALRLRAAVRAYIERGAAAVSFENVAAALPRLSVSFAGGLDRAFFARVARHADKLMRHELDRGVSARGEKLPDYGDPFGTVA